MASISKDIFTWRYKKTATESVFFSIKLSYLHSASVEKITSSISSALILALSFKFFFKNRILKFICLQ